MPDNPLMAVPGAKHYEGACLGAGDHIDLEARPRRQGRLLRLCLLIGLLWQTTAQAQLSVEVAVVGPMSGTSFSVGIQYKVGVTAALATKTDGTLLGHKVVMTTFDDNCQSRIAEKVAEKIVQTERPAVVIGHSCSAASIAAAPIYAAANVLQITPASTNPKVTEMGIGTIFRMIGRDDMQSAIAAQRIAERHQGKRLGVVYFPNSYSRELAMRTIARLKPDDIEPVLVLEGQPSAHSYSQPIQRLIDAGVEVVYLVAGALDSGVFLRQARLLDAGFKVISSDTLVSKVFIEAAGPAADAVPFTFPPDAAELATSEPAVEAIQAMGLEPVGYTLLAYAATEVWLVAVKRAGSFATQKVAAALREAPIQTILGPVEFDEKGDIRTSYPAFSWYVWQAGKRVPAD